MRRGAMGGSPPPSHVLTSASRVSPVLDPTRMRLGRGGLVVPASPMRTSRRCSTYVSGVVSGSMFTLIGRGGESIGVPGPVSHERDSVGPTYIEPVGAAAPARLFASTDRKRPA